MKEKETFDTSEIIMAYKHSPRYADDYKIYLKEYNDWISKGHEPDKIELRGFDAIYTLSKPAAKLCRKYNLRFPIDPDEPPHDSDFSYINAPIRYFIPMELMRRFDTFPDKKEIAEVIMSYIGNRLVLMIDTSLSRKQLREYFNKITQVWTPKSTKGIAKEDDIWKIYKMKTIEKKSLARITRELRKVKGNPNTDTNNATAYYAQVKRYYRRACEIVRYIETPH